MLSIRSIQNRDVRDEVAARYLDLCIGRMESHVGFPIFLEYLANRLPHGRIGVRFGRQLQLMATHPAILRDTGLWQSTLVVRIWNWLARTTPRRIVAPAADFAMQRIGMAIGTDESLDRERDRPDRRG